VGLQSPALHPPEVAWDRRTVPVEHVTPVAAPQLQSQLLLGTWRPALPSYVSENPGSHAGGAAAPL
jgi:hypothetical protein